MNEPRTIEGKWWICGDSNPPHFGKLTFDPEKELLLEVKNLVDLSFTEVLLRTADEKMDKTPPVLHGVDINDNPVTLFACGCDRYTHTSRLESFEISAIAGLIGERVSAWNEAKYLTARVHYTLLHEWLGENMLEHTETKSGRPAVTTKCDDDTRIYELPGGVRLRIESDSSMAPSLSKVEWLFGHHIYFHFPKEEGLEFILNRYVHSFRQLLSLLVGRGVFVEQVELFHSNPFEKYGGLSKVELLRGNHGISTALRNVHAARMLASFEQVAGEFGAILTRWFESHDRMEPVRDLYFGIVFQDPVTTTRFLNLAQALEAYHGRCQKFTNSDLPTAEHRQRVDAVATSCPEEYRQWVRESLAHANRKTLAQRFTDIFGLFENEVCQLFDGMPDVATRIRHTRNYLTHYDENSKSKALDENELACVTLKLEAFLQICLLNELGLTGAPIRAVVDRYAPLYFVDLDSVPKQQSQLPDAQADHNRS